jgi:lipoprotein-anchoring transpeptidase ErfK/SrfK
MSFRNRHRLALWHRIWVGSVLGLGLLQACGSQKPQADPPRQSSANAKAVKTQPKAEPNALRVQVRALESRVQKLEAAKSRAYPGGPVIMVDTSKGKIRLMLGDRVISEGTCSTGNGMELADNTGKRAWTFDTPRGAFRVLSKVTNPVWVRPDWSYIEEGEPIPKDRSKRAEANVLGDYALAFGNGFFIHGTLYTRLLGANVTHGCIRVDDVMLKKLYAAAQPGTPIWIY